MSRRRIACLTALLAACACAGACGPHPTSPEATAERAPVGAIDEPLQPVESPRGLDAARVALGEQLFHDSRLSHDGSVSCASCHPLGRGGMDGETHSVGAGQRMTAVNTPTIFNVSLNFRFNWNGAYDSLESALDAPLSRAMGTDWPEVIARVSAVPAYRDAFARAYPDGVTTANVRDALATFERSLVTPNARFDRYLRGDTAAITAGELEGYTLFRTYGCASCHQGAAVGGNLFQRMGVVDDYFAARGSPETPADLGRFATTASAEDRHVFRVPGLRNVARTAPYFHDGSAATLDRAIEVMARYQLGRPLDPAQRARIAEFLGTLTGEFRGRSL